MKSPVRTEIFALLKKKGLRLTPQREMVLSVICEAEGHLSAARLMTLIRKRYPYLNKSVVYRTLDTLNKIGLVDQTDFGKGYLEYELHGHPHHHHLYCRVCGRTIDMDEKILAELQSKIIQTYRFSASFKHLVISGLCEVCSKSKKKHKKD